MKLSEDYKRKAQGGFSLVELMVSAAVLGVSLAAILGMLSKGTEIDVNGDHRRQARAIIHAAFERPEFHFSRYKLLNQDSWLETVQLDSATDNPINANLRIVVSGEQTPNMAGFVVPYKEISMNLQWPEVEGQDSVNIVKYLAEPR